MKKQIGILTFHRAKNYGAVLQAFSLCNFLQNYGNCEIIDYKNKSIEEVYYGKKGLMPLIKKIIKNVVLYKEQKEKKIRFKRFDIFMKNEVKVSSEVYDFNNISQSNSKYDVFVVGSDQVWNLQLTNSDYSYFLDFSLQQTKIAYSCSFGNVSLINKDFKKICDCLRKFDLITIRETEGVDFINETKDLRASLACDPVFLTSKDSWIRLSKKSNISFKRPYIIIYEVANGTNLINKALSYAKENNFDVHIIGGNGKKYKIKGVNVVNYLGPYDFIKIINDSSAVFTTSFHGMALSLILNKPFSYELSKSFNNKNSRLITLAEIFEVKEYELDKNNIDKPVNWIHINQKISQLYKESVIKFDTFLGSMHE